MKEIEITSAPLMKPDEERATDLHSIFNMLNIMVMELTLLAADLTEKAELLESQREEFEAIGYALRGDEDVSTVTGRIRKTEGATLSLLQTITKDLPEGSKQKEASEAVENFRSIYRVLKDRIEEIELRSKNPDLWIEIDAKSFERQFREDFFAIEKNAKGRYRIYFNLARKTKQDYYIDLKIETTRTDQKLYIPLRLKDVLRDLLANARKYTSPGGNVALAVYQDDTSIRCVIEDNGSGIPEDEIERVSEFGYRASNMRKRRTMGGGFGLTKAVSLVLRWGGQFKIASGIDKGTRIQISVPNRSD